MAESNERGSSQPEKQKAERSSAAKKTNTSSCSKKSVEAEAVKSVLEDTNTKLLSAITNLQGAIQKQNARMSEQERKINDQNNRITEVLSRLNSYEEEYSNEYGTYNESGTYHDEHHEYPQQDYSSQSESVGKRKQTDEEDTVPLSRFASMCKRFKAAENCDKNIDQTLAENITDLFRNGIDENRYQDLVKDEYNARPGNCEGLIVVQTNPLIWDAVSPTARSVDKKMQSIEASVVKSATILAKVVDSMAKMEHDLLDNDYEADSPKQQFVEKFGLVIEDINSAVALLGHCNRQINLSRKDFLRPQLNKDYNHLCNHNRPFTNMLFGEDVSKVAKEIEDCSKISNKMFTSRPFRGSFVRGFRSYRHRGGFRGSRGVSTSERSSTTTSAMMQSQAKNLRRGLRQNYRH